MHKFSAKIYYHECLLQLHFIPEFPEISIEWFAFEKFTTLGFSEKCSQEISIPIAPISKVPDVFVKQNAPVVPALIEVFFFSGHKLNNQVSSTRFL